MNKNKLCKFLAVSGLALTSIGIGSLLPSSTAHADTQIGRVVYKPGYGINLWNYNNNKLTFSGRRLQHGSRWKITGTKMINNHLFYALGTNQYFDSSYITIEKTDKIEKLVPESGRVGEVVYKPGYGINLWNIKNNKLVFSGRRLQHGTYWQITGTIKINGHLFYALGKNQYFDSTFININRKTWTPNVSHSTDVNKVNELVMQYTNRERKRYGLSPLRIDNALLSVANVRAQEEVDSINAAGGDIYKMDHIRPDGSSCFTAFVNADFDYKGENVLVDFDQGSSETTAEDMIKMWMNSAGHRANILNPDYTSFGMKVIKTNNNYYLAMQDFGG